MTYKKTYNLIRIDFIYLPDNISASDTPREMEMILSLYDEEAIEYHKKAMSKNEKNK